MKFLVISDLHGDISMLEKIDSEFKSADAVLCGGDFAQFGKTETGRPMLEALCKKHDTIFSVIGNCDEPSFKDEIEAADISCEGVIAWHEGLAFCGSGGGSKFSGATPNERSDEDLAGDFNVVQDATTHDGTSGEWSNLIAIMHNPPKDTNCDKIESGVHVGSPSLRSFVEKIKPLAVITGHIHESAGIDKVGDTTIINPGSLAEGKYAIMEAEKAGDEWKITNAELCTVQKN